MDENLCEICGKILSRKQTLRYHRSKVHGIESGDLKKYKQYVHDPSVPIPRTTAYRKRKATQEHGASTVLSSVVQSQSASCSELYEDYDDDIIGTSTAEYLCNPENDCATIQPESFDDDHFISPSYSPKAEDFDFGASTSNWNVREHLNASEFENCSISTPENSESDSECSESFLYESDSETSDNDDMQEDNFSNNIPTFSSEEEKRLTLLSFLLRYNLGESGSQDLIKLLTLISDDCQVKDLSILKETIGPTNKKLYEFCEKCHTLFPDDVDIYRCTNAGCDGLRYKGAINKQELKRKKSYFTCLPLEAQIKDIFQREGIWKSITSYRDDCIKASTLNDILNGEIYKELRKPGNFLNDPNNFSLLFNTDGVPLFKSSSVSIWPIYLVINELPPAARFSRRNMIIWGIWQSKGKPVFRTFLMPFIKDMIDLKEKGLSIQVGGRTFQSHGILLSGTMDLQAKAYVTEMTQHNGKNGCFTCEDPGEVVKQGRGHTRVYPFRQAADLYKDRTSSELLACGVAAIESGKPELGVKGVSAFHGLVWFDIIWGLVPDYMHGVLLGVTKMLLKLWFSSSYADQPFFVGRSIKQIDKHLKKMKPTDDISRLPRKIENNMHHYKASELQMWLLFYSLPCLVDIMPHAYLNHYCLFVEGIYILLSDSISEAQLLHAESSLQKFYLQFGELYGTNNCTINLHNACQHLAKYVRKLGPVWAWSCFAFEDMNGTILEATHGTGEVCHQILWAVQARKRLSADVTKMRATSLRNYVEGAMNTRRPIIVKHEAENCKIAGGMKNCVVDDTIANNIKLVLGLSNETAVGKISKVGRIILNEQVIFSKFYSRMTKRIGYVVLLDNTFGIITNHAPPESMVASVQYFIYHHDSNKCLAVARYIAFKNTMPLLNKVVSHIIAVEPEDENTALVVISVEHIKEKLVYLNGNPQHSCVARLPNLFGQSC